MSLTAVHMRADVFNACVMHAVSVEKEEVMGLLIGKFETKSAHIISTIVLQRSDKRKDRVEISTEQLHSAMMKTLELSEKTGKSINVLGWYHSHPHITVQPSHVDLRTQASYQMMDCRFVGIIFSVFNEDKSKGQKIQVTCFQSGSQGLGGPNEKLEVPLYIESVMSYSPLCSESIVRLPHILSQEVLETYKSVKNNSENDYLTVLQNDSAFVTSQVHILKNAVNPLLFKKENAIERNLQIVETLREEKEKLQKLLQMKRDQKI